METDETCLSSSCGRNGLSCDELKAGFSACIMCDVYM